jgi:hypothetical protein
LLHEFILAKKVIMDKGKRVPQTRGSKPTENSTRRSLKKASRKFIGRSLKKGHKDLPPAKLKKRPQEFSPGEAKKKATKIFTRRSSNVPVPVPVPVPEKPPRKLARRQL